MPQCLICHLNRPDSQFPDPHTAPVCQPCMEEHSLQVDDLQVLREHAAATGDSNPRHVWIAPQDQKRPPVPEGALEAEATEKAVTCPNPDCGESFEINPWFYESLAECPTCGQNFVIRPPGALAARWLDSLPKDHPARATANANRDLRSSAELPPPMEVPMARARDGVVICPDCRVTYEVGPETAGTMVQCEKCHCEFRVMPG